MSGDQLRNYAILGSLDDLKNQLSGGANPCSVCEEQGLTALHYAVWNSHIECVHFLIANGCGKHPVTGEDCMVIHLKSKGGYTALHLAVMIEEKSEEICRLLISCGANPREQDHTGKSIIETAIDLNRHDILSLLETPLTSEEIDDFVNSLKDSYSLIRRRIHIVNKNNDYVDRRDLMVIPKELDMHEHQILPKVRKLVESNRSNGAEKIRNLKKLLNAAECSEKRREQLTSKEFKLSR